MTRETVAAQISPVGNPMMSWVRRISMFQKAV
jgi:hypothetical protein